MDFHGLFKTLFMKKYLLILIICFIQAKITTVSAQNYYTLPDSNVAWIVKQDDGFGGSFHWKFFTDTINVDTIINSNIYTKLYCKGYNMFDPLYWGAYRSDTTGFTYYIQKNSAQEYIIKNFNVNIGDTVKNVFMGNIPIDLNPGFIDLYIDSINYTTLGTYHLKKIYLSNHSLFPWQGSYIIWIEKIGTNTGGLFNVINPNGSTATITYCMNYNDTIYFDFSQPQQLTYSSFANVQKALY